MKADSTEKSEIDFSTLNEKSRRKLHRALYRQGCRAWLLWCAMGFGGFALFQGLHNKENFLYENALISAFIVLYSGYLSFWVVYPTQKFLMGLRKVGDVKENSNIERTFDETWASVWDFVPPLVIPVLGYLALHVVRLFFVFQK